MIKGVGGGSGAVRAARRQIAQGMRWPWLCCARPGAGVWWHSAPSDFATKSCLMAQGDADAQKLPREYARTAPAELGRRVRSTAEAVIDDIENRREPFSTPWPNWTADSSWSPPRLPPGWDVVHD